MTSPMNNWLNLRSSFVGGSELSALFDDVPEDCPYSSRWELWASKSGMLPKKRETDPMKWGKRHEATVIAAVAEDWGLEVQEWGTVGRDQFDPAMFVDALSTERGFVLRHECGLGGTPDGLVVVDGVVRVLEIKTVSEWAWMRWEERLPASYRLQGQAYCGLLDLPGVTYAVLVGGNRLVRFDAEANPQAYDGICAEVTRFWQEVKDGVEPSIRGRDYDAVQSWFSGLPVPPADKKAKPVAVDTEESQLWLAEYVEAERRVAELGEAEDAFKALKARGMRLFGEHRKVSVGGRTFTRVDVAPRPEMVVTQAARDGYAYIKAGGVK